MIQEFLTSALSQKAVHGQPLLYEAAINSYRGAARHFDRTCGMEADELSAELKFLKNLNWDPKCKQTILFVRPRSDVHAQSAEGVYRVVELSESPDARPSFANGRAKLPQLRWNWMVSNALSADPENSSEWTKLLIFELSRLLKAVGPSLICIVSDTPPLERAISLVANSLGIPVATIQHGLFTTKVDPAILEGSASNYFVVWGEFTKRLLSEGGAMAPDRIKVVGYPYVLNPLPERTIAPMDEPAIVFLGQNFEDFDPAKAKAKDRIVKLLQESCKQRGIRFLYRPHPAEKPESLSALVAPESLLSRRQPLAELFANYDCFVGLTSTALPEAALYGKTAIQVYDDAFEFENLGELGVCHSCQSTDEGVGRMLDSIINREIQPLQVSPDYISMPASLEIRLREIYAEIIAEVLDPNTTLSTKISEPLRNEIVALTQESNAACSQSTLREAKRAIQNARSLTDRLRATPAGHLIAKTLRKLRHK